MRKQWKQWETLLRGGSKINADGDCSHEIKRCLLLRRKVITNLLLLLLLLPSRFNRVWPCATPEMANPTRLCHPWDSPGKNTGVGCHFLLQCRKVKVKEVAQSCPTLCNPMDCSLPGSPVNGIFQARVLEWGAIAFSNNQPRQHIKKQRHYFANKGLSNQGYGFPSSHVWMWELDYKESWVPRNWCFWTVVLEKTPESPLDLREIQPVHPKGDQSWIFIGRTDVEAETPILWAPDVNNWLIGKDSDAGKDWGQEEKETKENEMVE